MRRRWLWAIAVFLTVLLSACMVRAHDWYPIDCCSGSDCGPVEKIDMIAGATFTKGTELEVPPLPVMFLTTARGSAFVPHNFVARASPDGRMHACIVAGRLICLFMPPGN